MAWIRCTGNTGGSLKVRTASGAIASFETNIADLLQEVKCEINASGGGGTPENPIPINGYTEANITRCGVNLWDEEWEQGGIDDSTGNNVVGNNVIRSKGYIKVEPNMVVYFPTNTRKYYYDANKNYLGHSDNSGGSFTIPANTYYLRIRSNAGYGNVYLHDMGVNFPATDTTYHPYTGNTYTIAFGQTVYGGVLDVTRGMLTVTHGYVDLGSLSWIKSDTVSPHWRFRGFKTGMKPSASASAIPNIKCDIYTTACASDSWIGVNNIIAVANDGDAFFIVDESYTTVEDFTSAVSGHYATYELATPIDIDLTPEQIEQLLGKNNVWHDANGDTEVKYLEVVRN